jgi:hypothetical protein
VQGVCGSGGQGGAGSRDRTTSDGIVGPNQGLEDAGCRGLRRWGGCEVGVNLLGCRLPYSTFDPGSRAEVWGST